MHALLKEEQCHSRLLKLGLDTNPVIATRLLQAYASQPCPPSLNYARQLFDQIPSPSRDAALWSAMISAYARSRRPSAAIRLLSDLLLLPSLPHPLSFSFASAARAAAAICDALLARSLHAMTIRRGILPNVVVSTSLLDMYSKCGSLNHARSLFDEMRHRNAVSWNSIIAAYASGGKGAPALELFYRLKCIDTDTGADEFAVASGLTACATLGDLRTGMQIHGYAVTSGIDVDSTVANATAKMYFRCRQVGSAETALEGREVNPLSKLLMIKGHVFNEKYADAVNSIGQGDGFVPLFLGDESIAVTILNCCANLELLRLGRQVHSIIFTLGYHKRLNSLENDDAAILGSALIDMYSRCSSIREAWLVFNHWKEKDVSHWNTMISGCIYNSLLEEAWGLFSDMPCKNVVSWTCVISGCVQHGLPTKGLEILTKMYNGEGCVRGNSFTFATALDACSRLAALDAGKQIHAQVLKTQEGDGRDNVVVATALVDMYCRSGNLGYARRMFDNMGKMNVYSWTSMITGYAAHGYGSQAIIIFEEMIRKGFVPNEVTFVSVLSACSHCGLIEQGVKYFNLMKSKYGIAPRDDHYACLVDLLGRAGKLVEAQKFLEIQKNGDVNDAAIWGALLGGCKLHGNVEIGNKVAMEMIEKKHQACDTFIALSNVYASSENWNAVYNVRETWKRRGFARKPGHSIV